MTEIAIIDWFGRWGTSVFSENTAIVLSCRGSNVRTISNVKPSHQPLKSDVT